MCEESEKVMASGSFEESESEVGGGFEESESDGGVGFEKLTWRPWAFYAPPHSMSPHGEALLQNITISYDMYDLMILQQNFEYELMMKSAL